MHIYIYNIALKYLEMKVKTPFCYETNDEQRRARLSGPMKLFRTGSAHEKSARSVRCCIWAYPPRCAVLCGAPPSGTKPG